MSQTLDFYWEGDDLMGYVEVLPTPAGCTLRDFYLAGARLGMSSRGWATLKEEDGALLIQNDFELITCASGPAVAVAGAPVMCPECKL